MDNRQTIARHHDDGKNWVYICGDCGLSMFGYFTDSFTSLPYNQFCHEKEHEEGTNRPVLQTLTEQVALAKEGGYFDASGPFPDNSYAAAWLLGFAQENSQ